MIKIMLEKIDMQIFAYPFVFYWFLDLKKLKKINSMFKKIFVQSFSFS